MGKHAIDDLTSVPYHNAVKNVANIVNRSIGHEVLSEKDWERAEKIATCLNVMFDESGDIAH